VCIPDLLIPAPQLNALLIVFDGLLVSTETLQGLGEIEVRANIRRLFFQFRLEHREVARELIGLAAAVIAVIYPELGVTDIALIRTIPVFVGRTDALPGLVNAQKTGVNVMERAGLLGQRVALLTKVLLLVKGGLYYELHIGVDDEHIGSGGVPVELVAELLGVIEGLGAINTEVGPRVIIGLGGNREGRIEILKNLDGVVRGTRVRYTDCIGNFEGRGDRSTDDS